MVSPTCELSYLVWLTQRTTNTHGILKLKFQVPWITQFPDQTRNCQLTIRFEGPCIIFCNIYTFQQDTQCCSTDCLLMHRCQLYMFWTVTVHPQELLFRCCMCRLWYVITNALSDMSRWLYQQDVSDSAVLRMDRYGPKHVELTPEHQ